MKKRIGSIISFFGTVYTIHEIVKDDVVRVKQNNGVIVTLWFPCLRGREVLTY
jgi:hypothetical protein